MMLSAKSGVLAAARTSSASSVLAAVFVEKMHCPYSDLAAAGDQSMVTWKLLNIAGHAKAGKYVHA